MKPIIFTLDFERSTKNPHRYSESAPQGDAKPMVVYVQKKDMPQPAQQIEVEVRPK